jgi:molybdopterin adenylyltransferase
MSMPQKNSPTESFARIGILTVSDRASTRMYEDTSGPAIRNVLTEILSVPWVGITRIIPDGIENVRDAVIRLIDTERCDMVLTTGGTGPAPRT